MGDCMKITGKAIRNTGLALLVAFGGGYAATREYDTLGGRSVVQVVQEDARDIVEMHEYRSAMRSAPSIDEHIDFRSDDFQVDQLESEARSRGITDTEKVDEFVKRALELNDFKPAANNPFIDPAIDHDAYGTIIIHDFETSYTLGSDTSSREVFQYGYLARTVDHPRFMILTKGKDGKIKYGRMQETDFHPEIIHEYTIRIPNILYDDSPTDVKYKNDPNYQQWFEVHPEVEPPHRLRKASVPSDSYADSTRAHANHFAGRKK